MQAYLNCMLSKQMFNPQKLHSTTAILTQTIETAKKCTTTLIYSTISFSDMTKTGKSSAYWNDICHRYAQGTFQFSTGKRPGSKKWKEALERIDACPLQRGNKVDLFGRQIVCTCGFHKVGILYNISKA